MKKLIVGVAVVGLATSAFVTGNPAAATEGSQEQAADGQEFVVLYAEDVSIDEARAAIEAAGGTIVTENAEVGVATVTTANADFQAAASADPAIEGTAQNRIIADVPETVGAAGDAAKSDPANAEIRADAAGPPVVAPARRQVAAEPLAGLQWDMQQIDATTTGSYRYEQGEGVRVGILDTGVDGTHPDIAPNFDGALSRNFTVDIPVDANGASIDGPCEVEPDGSCNDAANVDENGHGTHVASTIAAPINGLGIAGVAPRATIVNLRAGQDSGYFFLQPSVDALTYAALNGIDVINMSYYVDPWLFNCTDHPADSPVDQAEQRTIIVAMQRALDFAHRRGVTLVSSAGNGASDYTKVISDASSPDYASEPGEVAYTRDLLDPNSCVSMPSEGDGVITVSSTGPSTRKAYYSNYGFGYIDVAAPGGDLYDNPTNTRTEVTTVLAAYPEALAIAAGAVDENGDVVVPWAVKSCDTAGTCAYYQYLQGTSMASPHTAGVAALIVGKYGVRDRHFGGTTLPARLVETILERTATATPCPTPPAYTYTRHLPSGATVTATHVCEGNRRENGFYGAGIVNALEAIGR